MTIRSANGAERRTEWANAEFRELAAYARERAGLVFAGTRISSAEDAMRRVMTRLGFVTAVELRRAVSSSDAARDALLDELTIGESYFFREPRQLELVRRALVSLKADPARVAPLRLWSAGCAAGEEPYSLAVLLREQHVDAGARIVGTDVSVGRLAAARRGRYTRWALRGVSEERIGRYFEQQGKHFTLAANIRAMVEFRPLNLAGDEYPSDVNGIANMDVILCRNVLIYMDLPTVAAVAKRLLASLSPDGWLFLGASDPPLSNLVKCEAITTNDGTAYRRSADGAAARPIPFPMASSSAPVVPSVAVVPPTFVVAAPSAPAIEHVSPTLEATRATPVELTRIDTSPTDRAAAAYRAGDYDTAIAIARAEISQRGVQRRVTVDDMSPRADEIDSVILVRALSNLGRVGEAAEACAAAVERHRTSPELAYLYAILLLHAGHHEAAATAARRALYLDRSFVLAHLALGDAFARGGKLGRARRAFRNAVTLLESAPPDAELPGADGEAAARFLRIGLDQLSALEPKPIGGARGTTRDR